MSNTKEKSVCWEDDYYETETLLYFMLSGIPSDSKTGDSR